MREAQAHLIVTADRLDNDLMLFNTPGGKVDLRTGERVLPAAKTTVPSCDILGFTD